MEFNIRQSLASWIINYTHIALGTVTKFAVTALDDHKARSKPLLGYI